MNEPAYQRLIQLHFANGDRAAAQRVYDACKLVLARDLGVAPSPDTDAALALARSAAFAETFMTIAHDAAAA